MTGNAQILDGIGGRSQCCLRVLGHPVLAEQAYGEHPMTLAAQLESEPLAAPGTPGRPMHWAESRHH